ncbi:MULTISPECIES: trypco2 family protein [unclassified Streptomyces]|uniref:trypco2 family protein n=1 Tax=unclassified Streptomyces TaxID=2593676 RepID=UPI0027413549|nr:MULTISPECIES: trypco2 family protein [unclassified Streptomyces]
MGLTEAVQAPRAELLAAQRDRSHQDIQFPVQSITIELKVAATRSADGRAGFNRTISRRQQAPRAGCSSGRSLPCRHKGPTRLGIDREGYVWTMSRSGSASMARPSAS